MTGLATVSIERAGDGWLVTCSCGMERLCGRRPSADRVAFDHRKTHGTTPYYEDDLVTLYHGDCRLFGGVA